MTNPPPQPKRSFDLEERTSVFGEKVIQLAKKVRVTPVTKNLITQLVDAANSVGANYCEADDSLTKKEFRHSIGICRRESREARFHLRQVVAAQEDLRAEASPLRQEARELNLIFSAILRDRSKEDSDEE